jgi:hypothetical protein
MASTFSNLGLNLQATGENSGTWGSITNVNLQDIDAAISGVYPITVTGNTTLAFTTNSSSTTYTDEVGRNKIIVLNGSLSATTITITTPNIEKDYVIINNSGATATISAGGSTTVSIATSTKAYIYVDGANAVNFCLPQPVTGLSIGGTTSAIQFNSAGALAGSTNFTWDGANLNIGNTGAIRLQDTAGGEYIGLKAANTIASSFTLTLPTSDGTSGQALITNGSGTLSFGSAGITAGKSIALTLVFG